MMFIILAVLHWFDKGPLLQRSAGERQPRILFKHIHKLIPVPLLMKEGEELDAAFAVVILKAARRFLLRKKILID